MADGVALVAVDPVVGSAIEMVANDPGEWQDIHWTSKNDCWRKARDRTTKAGLYREETEIVAFIEGSEDCLVLAVTSEGVLYEEWVEEQIQQHAPRSWKTWRGSWRGKRGCELTLVRRVITDKGKLLQDELSRGVSEPLRLLLAVLYKKVGQPKPKLLRQPEVRQSNPGSETAASSGPTTVAAAQATATVNNEITVASTPVDSAAIGRGVAEALAPTLEKIARAASEPTDTWRDATFGSVNERMTASLEDDPSRVGLSKAKWAELLGCGATTVSDTAMWTTIQDMRKSSQHERAGGFRDSTDPDEPVG